MKLKYAIGGLLLLLGLAACSACSEDVPVPSSNRTVLVYMIAENSLSSFGYSNIENMLKGVTATNLNGGNLLVYFDPVNSKYNSTTKQTETVYPQLIKIKYENGAAVKEVIKTYEEQNSASSEVMLSVINEVVNDSRFQSDSYGLMLWSHGTAWLPSDWSRMLRAFGQDGVNWMEINELAVSIPDKIFDFIIFDACYMSSIEVAYAMRNKADYIIGSPTEIMGSGFPYELIITPMFKETADLVGVCDNFYNYYDKQSGLNRSATIALIDTKGLEDLKNATRSILNGKYDDVKAMSTTGIQPMDYLSNKNRMLYDFDDFIGHYATGDAYTNFTAVLGKTIIYKKSTPNSTYSINGGTSMAMTHFSGINSYIPQAVQTDLNDWYTQLDWYKAVY